MAKVVWWRERVGESVRVGDRIARRPVLMFIPAVRSSSTHRRRPWQEPSAPSAVDACVHGSAWVASRLAGRRGPLSLSREIG